MNLPAWIALGVAVAISLVLAGLFVLGLCRAAGREMPKPPIAKWNADEADNCHACNRPAAGCSWSQNPLLGRGDCCWKCEHLTGADAAAIIARYDECVCFDDEHADLEPLRADFFDKGPIPPWKDAELQHFRLWGEELRQR